MAQATRPLCAWCNTEPGSGRFDEHPPNYRQELILRTVNGVLVWLHLQCESHYRLIGK